MHRRNNCGCSSNPCKSETTRTDQVIYNGVNLSCTTILNGDSLTVALQKIDEQICELIQELYDLTTTTTTTIILDCLLEGDINCGNSTTTTTSTLHTTTTSTTHNTTSTTTTHIPITTTTSTTITPTTSTTSTTTTINNCLLEGIAECISTTTTTTTFDNSCVIEGTIYCGNCQTLGNASNYSVLAYSTITNTGDTVITGDLGLFPGSSVTGFPPGIVSGIQHITDTSASNAKIAAQSAYDCLWALTPTGSVGADIGGTSINPGIYSVSSSLAITGIVTLNGGYNPDAVFVFQIPSTFIPANNATVELINNIQPCNVYWVVGSSATLSTSSTIVGNIIANTSITLDTSAILTGRAFALTGAVTMDTNTVANCECSINPCSGEIITTTTTTHIPTTTTSTSTLTPTTTTTTTITPTTTTTTTVEPTTTTTTTIAILYGYLYNWAATTNVLNIANTGWHVPTETEFVTLQSTLDPGGNDASNVAGGAMKEIGTTYWNSPNTGATNSSGFSGRGAGKRATSGIFGSQKIELDMFTSTNFDSTYAYGSGLSNNTSLFIASSYTPPKAEGLSLRLIKDDSIDTGSYVGNDGKLYTTVTIGTQVWLTENLKETQYRDHSSIPNVISNVDWAALTTDGYCLDSI